jgi:hypothetical protein
MEDNDLLPGWTTTICMSSEILLHTELGGGAVVCLVTSSVETTQHHVVGRLLYSDELEGSGRGLI